MVAFDAVRPGKSRFKIYLRTKDTSFARLEEILILGGTLSPRTDDLVSKGLALIETFYKCVFGLSSRDEEILPHSTHRTAGLIFNLN